MRNRRLLFATAIVFGVSSASCVSSAEPLRWAGPLTLAQAVQRAQTADFDVRIAQADTDAFDARAGSARGRLLPQLGLSATSINGGITQLGMPVAQQTYVSAVGLLPLFAPQDVAAARAAEQSARSSFFEVATRRNDAGLLATQSYERTLLAEAIVTSRGATVAYEDRHVLDMSARIRTGDAARYQLFESRAALAQARQGLEDAQAESDEAMADLLVLLDLRAAPGLHLADALEPTTMLGDEGAFSERALTSRPDLLAAAAQVEAARARSGAARARYLPTITANAQTYNGHSNPSLGATGYQVGVTGSIPIFDGTRSPAIREATADLTRAQVEYEKIRLGAQRDVSNSWREYQAAHRNLATVQARSVAAAEEVRIVSLREQTGKGTTLEFLAAVSDDASARENSQRAVARFNDAIAALHHAAGDFASPQ